MYLTNVDGTLFFIADDGTNGYELWKSDGTEAGTVMIKDIRPGSADSLVNYLTNADGVLYFRANDGTNGYELWKSNGTEAGTVMVQDIWPGSGSADPQDLLLLCKGCSSSAPTITNMATSCGRRQLPLSR